MSIRDSNMSISASEFRYLFLLFLCFLIIPWSLSSVTNRLDKSEKKSFNPAFYRDYDPIPDPSAPPANPSSNLLDVARKTSLSHPRAANPPDEKQGQDDHSSNATPGLLIFIAAILIIIGFSLALPYICTILCTLSTKIIAYLFRRKETAQNQDNHRNEDNHNKDSHHNEDNEHNNDDQGDSSYVENWVNRVVPTVSNGSEEEARVDRIRDGNVSSNDDDEVSIGDSISQQGKNADHACKVTHPRPSIAAPASSTSPPAPAAPDVTAQLTSAVAPPPTDDSPAPHAYDNPAYLATPSDDAAAARPPPPLSELIDAPVPRCSSLGRLDAGVTTDGTELRPRRTHSLGNRGDSGSLATSGTSGSSMGSVSTGSTASLQHVRLKWEDAETRL